jgi:Heparinase II/III-like protein
MVPREHKADPDLATANLALLSDHEVFCWRSDWNRDATAFSFKCGPPEGHHTAAMLEQFPDWRLSDGHAHPDANSFIVFARGQYLTGDTGYAGVPMTEHRNTMLVNGKGQAKEGRAMTHSRT